jgi:ubiquitin carboxyl-terminal hydrolase 10
VKAVLQLLVHSPPFWDLVRELSDLKGRRGAGGPETAGSATPLLDATVRFFEEFEFKEKEPPPTQRSPQRAAGRKPRKDEKGKKEHNAVPTYMYDAMKEKRQLKGLIVRSCDQDAPFCY